MHVYKLIKIILSLQIFIILIVFFGCCKPVHSKNAVNNKDSIEEPTNHIFHEELSNSHETPHHIGNHSVQRYRVATFDFDHVSTPYIVSLWIIIVGLAKIGFKVTPKLSSLCPESVVLMLLGVVIGLSMFFSGISEDKLQPLTPNLFFIYMLPPIVMDAGYHMPNRLFFDNLISILLYAVVGTVWNALAIGLSLYGCAKLGIFGQEIPLLDIMLFSSTVSAVDPVAVLAVFEEIKVNEVLYILVFGESLLNDAVTVVLYHMFEGYAEMTKVGGIESVLPIDYVAGIASFFVISLGGTFMGVIWGFLAAFVSRFTHHVKIIEPIFVFVMAYLAYLSAEMFHLSGILSLTFCGITMKNYVEENITQKSHTTLKYAMKMLANSSEAIIFVFLGVCTVNDYHEWNTAFVVLTILFCIIYRTIGVLVLTGMINKFRLHRLNGVEQFIMSYGGLRGAVAFALILIVDKETIPSRQMMVTTIIAVVYFTVFLQGMTVGALVKILNVPRSNKYTLSMNERIHTRMIDHMMSGMEDICGMMVGNYKIRDKFRYYNNKYLRVWLLNESDKKGNSSRKIFETCSKLDLQDAMNMVSKQNLSTNLNNNLLQINHSNNHLTVLSANKSLSALFRTYTQSNLTNINDEYHSPSGIPTDPIGSVFNFDIGNLSYSPSYRDLADAEIHHILDDAMFKPVPKVRRYSRADLSEVPSPHPPFQHQMRMQIRSIISQHHKRKKFKRSHRNGSDESRDPSPVSPEITSLTNLNLNVKKSPYLKPDSHQNSPSESPFSIDTDDTGITFTAKSDDSPNLSNRNQSNESSPTITESTLPWRRSGSIEGEGKLNSSAPIKQEEFPPWIDNKEYMPSYASPTNTFLDKLDETKRSNSFGNGSHKLPAVFEIFTLNHEGDKTSDSKSRTKGRFKFTSANDIPNLAKKPQDKNQQTQPQTKSQTQTNPNTVAINMGFEGDDHTQTIYKL